MKDFLEELEIEGFTSRIKRLSDSMLYSTRNLYKLEGMEIEPNWNLVFRLFQQHGELTVSFISEQLQFSHPAVIKIINKMKKRGYVESSVDEADQRKSILTLTSRGEKHLVEFEKIWSAQNTVITRLLADSPNLMKELSQVERNLQKISYEQEVIEELNS